MHNGGMTPENVEFQTIRITPASMTRRKKYARRREQELAQIDADGWEIVDIESERIFRAGDKVTVRRAAAPSEPAMPGPSWWGSLDDKQRVAVGLMAVAVVVLIAGIASML
jgi:hypothetical protein